MRILACVLAEQFLTVKVCGYRKWKRNTERKEQQMNKNIFLFGTKLFSSWKLTEIATDNECQHDKKEESKKIK